MKIISDIWPPWPFLTNWILDTQLWVTILSISGRMFEWHALFSPPRHQYLLLDYQYKPYSWHSPTGNNQEVLYCKALMANYWQVHLLKFFEFSFQQLEGCILCVTGRANPYAATLTELEWKASTFQMIIHFLIRCTLLFLFYSHLKLYRY